MENIRLQKFREHAKNNGWFDKILHENIIFSMPKKSYNKGFLKIVKDAFPNNHVVRESQDDKWIFIIYCGDKKTLDNCRLQNFREYAKKNGWFEEILHKNIRFSIPKEKCQNGILKIIRDTFPNNYVDKDSEYDKWIFTIYCGDKETMEFWYKPLRLNVGTEQQNKRDAKKYLKQLEIMYNKNKQK